MEYKVKQGGIFRYIDEGFGEPMVLLHGLFGALSNWDDVIERFKHRFRIIIPVLPIYDLPIKSAGIPALVRFVESFIKAMKLKKIILVGNSLGGHLGLMYTLNKQANVKRLILTGSSGLFENQTGGSFPRRRSYEFVQEKVAYTFYDPEVATKELIDSVFEITKSIPHCLRIVSIAKSAQRQNMANEIKNILVPTLLIWGLNDTITPPLVAHEFNRLIPNSDLNFIDKCCHAPMMEQPNKFNSICEEFLTDA